MPLNLYWQPESSETVDFMQKITFAKKNLHQNIIELEEKTQCLVIYI